MDTLSPTLRRISNLMNTVNAQKYDVRWSPIVREHLHTIDIILHASFNRQKEYEDSQKTESETP